jgi:hypothetical protein
MRPTRCSTSSPTERRPLRAVDPSARLNPDVITRNSEGLSGDADAVVLEPIPRPRSIFPGSGAVHFSTRGEYGVRLMVELARH